jgi:lipoprotein-anchoring transpeptidase ErfK/SrfK
MKKLFTLTFLLFSILGNVFFSAQTTHAGVAPGTIGNVFTYVVKYVVKQGDSLSAIAGRYGITLNALVQANRLSHWTIYPGQQLMVPSKTTPNTGSTPPQTPAPSKTTPSTGNTPPQTPAPSKNKSIYVSMSQQRMYVYENGAQIYTFPVSTGQAGRETLPGNYRVKTRIDHAWGSAWRIWMPSWLGIYNVGRYENGIHAVPITENGEVMWENSIGQPASYGCVVLRTNDAATLYQWADLGTPVTIRH